MSAFSPTNIGLIPIEIPSCITWLDATDPSGNGTQPADSTAIATWIDKSGRGNSPTQATGANQPLFKLNIQGQKPIIRFDGSNDNLIKTSYFNLKQFSIFVVGTANTINGGLVDVTAGAVTLTGMQIYQSVANFFTTFIQGTSTTKQITQSSSAPTGFHNYNTYYDGTNFGFYLDGSLIAANSATANTNTIDTLTIGSLADGTRPLNGDICEVIIYNRTLTGPERIAVQGYLSGKWGTPA